MTTYYAVLPLAVDPPYLEYEVLEINYIDGLTITGKIVTFNC